MSKILYRLKLYKNGKMIYQTTRKKKLALLAFCKAKFLSKSIDKLWLRVLYGKGQVNEGIYKNLKDFTLAYRAFTEQSLIDYIRKG